ncbi:flavoprotein [Armillaria borealis]|uniref:Flavoprotein n=1 Tax=Armillaria borealis TaxID=47425 RepID=A0AA39MXA7_9AGAR|nr:flavoprotein [Armillaria borealis]
MWVRSHVMLLRLGLPAKKALSPRHLRFQPVRTMSAKSLPVLDESELKDGEMKEVDFEQGKVLLSRLGDKIHATSAYCTHYGAPLAKGVLTYDGRVTCPWHGACFHVSSGDIEDAPAPAGITLLRNPRHRWQDIRQCEPRICTEGEEWLGLLNCLPRVLMLLAKEPIIVGGGAGAFSLVESLRENGYKYPITILTKEPHAPIDRTKLSKALITDPSKLEWKNAAELKVKFGTNVRTGVTVTSIDFPNRKVIIDGKDSLIYDKLVLATGGIPRRLPIPGADLENVFTFRTVEDAQKVDAAAQKGKRVVVIGSSFISMELVVALAKRGLESIDVIGMEEYPFEAVLGKEVGKGLMKYHESQGVKFHMSSKVEKIVPHEDNDKLATGVIVNGETLPADFIIMGVGVAPATDFLKGLIELEADGSVKVDEYLRAIKTPPGVKGVFAIGDIAVAPVVQKGRVVTFARIEHWNVASNQGRVLGRSIAGTPRPYSKLPFFWSAQGQQLRYGGYGAGHDEVTIVGDPGELKFIAYYSKSGKIIAVASMQNDPVASKALQLLRLGMMPTLAELKERGLETAAVHSTASSHSIRIKAKIGAVRTTRPIIMPLKVSRKMHGACTGYTGDISSEKAVAWKSNRSILADVKANSAGRYD